MAALAAILLGAVLSSCGQRACDEAIGWSEASRHIGEESIVRGSVEGATFADYVNGSPTFLNIGADYPSQARFTALIWGGDRPKFGTPPETAYDGKEIAVTGTITSYEGIPEVEVSEPSQIEVCSG